MSRRSMIVLMLVALASLPARADHPGLENVGTAVRIPAHPPDVLTLGPGASANVDAAAAEDEGQARPQIIDDFGGVGDDGSVFAPGTSAAAGLDHVVIASNRWIQVRDKVGNIVTERTLDTFWDHPGMIDPRIAYDPYGNRWLITAVSTDGYLHVGVSRTSNPVGQWWAQRYYRASQRYPRTPALGFNKRYAVVQANYFDANGAFENSRVLVMDKPSLYRNGYPTGQTMRNLPSNVGGFQIPALTYDPDAPEMYLVQHAASNHNGRGYIAVWSIAEEFARVLSTPSIPSPWSAYPPTANFAPQAHAPVGVDAGDARMQSVVFRNGSLWAAHSVFLSSPARASIQWWQVTPSGTVQQQGRVDDPSGAEMYAYPSIAVNSAHDVLVGYSKFSAVSYPSAAVSFRLGADTPGTMRPSQTYRIGLAPYVKLDDGVNRWGPHSATTVDPDQVDLWAAQQYADDPGASFGRWGTWWARFRPDAVPLATASASTLDFANEQIGMSSVRTVTISNPGTGRTTLGAAVVTGSGFAVVNDSCSDAQLKIGASCTFDIRFAPAVEGPHSGQVAFATDAYEEPVEITLDGVGVNDVTAPTTQITTDEEAVLAWPLHTLHGRSTDDLLRIAAVQVEYRSTLTGAVHRSAGVVECGPDPRECTWTATLPPIPGRYVATAWATDRAGNVEAPGASVEILVI